ncbi:glycosyl transferase [Hyphomicrobium methylovorum]|uniref:glycosyltransferase family 2 protein n=1 Tax=Hyphomicrobium methylovorum TaxID=84 RepID=UPI0015E7C1E0|nr:glycosyltransferase family 2 protein [Hyphomicrobium methylovorum]MBA2127595.1 glycosyl transferase [Hyphomicrobium methylovorum]
MSFVLFIANAILLTIAAAALVAVLTLALEVVMSPFRTPASRPSSAPRSPIAVIVPAHNEAGAIAATIEEISKQLSSADRLLVVADNCTDETALIARRAGAEVVERNDTTRIGKGYALDAGVKHLEASDPRDVIVFVDADCRLSDSAIEYLARACAEKGGPVQGIYLMNSHESATARQRIATFAWRVRNKVRPLGYHALGMPCLLTGSGMAIPRHVLKRIDLATGHITEDTLISVECALQGYPPTLCPDAEITSDFAPTESGRDVQKTRWMHGHLSAIISLVPRLIVGAVRKRDIRLLALAADIAVPPLGLLLALLVILTLVTATLLLATGYALPFILSFGAGVLAFLALLLAWAKGGRDLIGAAEVREISQYALRQLSVAKDFVAGRRAAWIRSERDR